VKTFSGRATSTPASCLNFRPFATTCTRMLPSLLSPSSLNGPIDRFPIDIAHCRNHTGIILHMLLPFSKKIPIQGTGPPSPYLLNAATCRNHAAIRRNDLEYSATVFQKRPDIPHRADTTAFVPCRDVPQSCRDDKSLGKNNRISVQSGKSPWVSVFTGNHLLPKRGNAGTQEATGTGYSFPLSLPQLHSTQPTY